MDEQEKSMIDDLIITGALEVAGVDSETGDFLYQFTPKLKDVNPDLYEEHINHVNNEIMVLWELGFVDINMMDDNPKVVLTEKAFDKNELSKLDKDKIWNLNEIKRLLKQQEL